MSTPEELLQSYRELEAGIRKDDLAGLIKRWEFGRAVLAECEENGGNKLPDGRLAALANALAISRTEIKNRKQFAEEYPTQGDVRNLGAVSWREVCRSCLGARNAGAGKPPAGPVAANDDDEADDAFKVPERLRERLARVAREAFAAGRAESGDYLGYGIDALLEFVEGDGGDAWNAWLRSPRELAEVA